MFCPKCGNEIQEGSAFCGKCGAPVGGAQQAASSSAGIQTGGVPAPKKNTVKIGIIAAVAVVVVVLVAGFATNWFGIAGVQPKEAVDVPAPTQSEQPNDSVAESDGQADSSSAQTDNTTAQQVSGSAVVKSAVEAYTWDELSQISSEIAAAGSEDAAIEVAKRYNLCTPDGKLDGTQVKSVTLSDGTQTAVQIAGFAHDDKTSGGKAGITFIFGDCISEASMNSSATNAGGWESCQMRSYLNSDGMALLPEDLRKRIVAVDKLTNNVGETQDVASVTVTSDSLWLFSYAELVGPIRSEQLGVGSREEKWAAVFNAEGAPYKLFNDMRDNDTVDAIMVKSIGGEALYWWERSSDPRESSSFQLVIPNGYPRDYGADATYADGVVPGFCI